jgi:hypothetical protein
MTFEHGGAGLEQWRWRLATPRKGPRLLIPMTHVDRQEQAAQHRKSTCGGSRRGGALRPRAGRSRWRPIYRRIGPSTFVVFAVGPEAGIDSRGYDQAVARALARFERLDVE